MTASTQPCSSAALATAPAIPPSAAYRFVSPRFARPRPRHFPTPCPTAAETLHSHLDKSGKATLGKSDEAQGKIAKLSLFTPPPTSTCISSRGIPGARLSYQRYVHIMTCSFGSCCLLSSLSFSGRSLGECASATCPHNALPRGPVIATHLLHLIEWADDASESLDGATDSPRETSINRMKKREKNELLTQSSTGRST